MSMSDILAYKEDCSRRLENLYFRCVVLPNVCTRAVKFKGHIYGPCEQCDTVTELSFEKFEDDQGNDAEIFLCSDCLEHVYGRMQQRMEDDEARERRGT